MRVGVPKAAKLSPLGRLRRLYLTRCFENGLNGMISDAGISSILTATDGGTLTGTLPMRDMGRAKWRSSTAEGSTSRNRDGEDAVATRVSIAIFFF